MSIVSFTAMNRLVSSIIFLLFTGSRLSGAEELIEAVAAEVNGKPIMYSSVVQKKNSGFPISISYFPAQEDDSLYRKTLEDSINFELVRQKADEFEIQISDAEVDAQIDQTLASRGLGREGLSAQLSLAGMSMDEYRASVERQMIFRRFQGRVIRPQIRLTEKDIESYYLKKSAGGSRHVIVELSQILIKVPPDASNIIVEGKQKIVQDIRKKLSDGLEFAQAARLYSDEESARDTAGRMNPLNLNDFIEIIQRPVSQLEVGGITPPIKSEQGFHFFKLENKSFDGGDEFKRLKPQIETELMIAESERQTQKWLTEGRAKASIKISDLGHD